MNPNVSYNNHNVNIMRINNYELIIVMYVD